MLKVDEAGVGGPLKTAALADPGSGFGAAVSRPMQQLPPIFEAPSTMLAVVGLDGAGKSTQCARLERRLSAQGIHARLWASVSLQPVRRAFARALCEAGGDPGPGPPSHSLVEAVVERDVAQLLTSVLKLDSFLRLEEIEPCDLIILDRYASCHIAAAHATQVTYSPLIESLAGALPEPAMTVLLRIPPEVALERANRRGTDRMELGFLRAHARAYDTLARAHGWVVLDGERREEQISAELHQLALGLLHPISESGRSAAPP